MRKAFLLMALTCLLACAACEKKQPASAGSSSQTVEPQSSAVVQQPEKPVEQKDPAKTPTESELSMSDARRLLAETIDTEKYLLLDAKTNLEVDGHRYYVFIVADRADSKAVGQVAVDKATGEKYNYEGEGHLGAYSDFSLYDPVVDAVYDWEGVFTDGSRTLELLPMDAGSFEYLLDERDGVARIEGGKAKDAENDIAFAWNEDGSLTLSGAAEGVFSPAGA